MGTATTLMKRGATNQPIAAPAAIETTELMIRLRSSIRCSKNDICPPAPSSGSDGFGELTSSWLSLVIGLMRGGSFRQGAALIGRGGFFGWYRGGNLDGLFPGKPVGVRSAGHGFLHRLNDRLAAFARHSWLGENPRFRARVRGGGTCQLFLPLGFRFLLRLLPLRFPVLALDIAHFLFERHFEVVGSLSELRHEFAQAAGKLRQLVRPEEHQHD